MASKLSAQVGAVVFGRIFVSLIDSLKVFLLVRLMTKDSYGALAFALAWQATAIGLGQLAIPDSLLYFLPRLVPGIQRSLVRQSLVLLGVVGLGLGLVISIFALVPGLQPLDGPEMSGALLCVAVGTSLELPAGVVASFLLGVQRHRASALVAMSLSLLANAALLIPAAMGASTVDILTCYAAVSGVRLAIAWIAWRQVFKTVPAVPFEGGLREQLAFALPLSLNGLAGLVNRYFWTYVVGWMLTAAAFADYAIGGRELPFVSMIPYAVATALLPRFSELAGKAEDTASGARAAIALWHPSIERVALVMLPIWILSLVEAEAMLTVFYGETYVSAAVPFRITAMLLPLRVTSYGVMLMALGRPRTILRAQLLGMGFNVLATLPLLAWVHYGGDNAPDAGLRIAWACGVSVLATYVCVVVMLRDIGREAEVGFAGSMPWSGCIQRMLIAIVAAAPLALWHLLFDQPTTLTGEAVMLIARLLVYLAVYLALILSAGLVPADDRDILFQWLRLEPLWRKQDPHGGGDG